MTVPCSDWSICRSHLHCSLVDDRVLFGPKVCLASIVLLLMTVFWLVRRSVWLPLFSCRWPCSDCSVGRSHLCCSIAHDRVLIGPWSVSSPLFYCAWPCSDWSVGRSRIHCSIVDDSTVFWLIHRSVSPPLFTCRWPGSHWSLGWSCLHWSIVDDRVLIGP